MRGADHDNAARRDPNTSPIGAMCHGATLVEAWPRSRAACYFRRVRRLGIAMVLVLPACKDEPPHVVRKVIGRNGGQVSSHDDVLTLTFQPGALAGETEIEIAPSDTPPMIFGPAYRVKPGVDLETPIDVTYRHALPADPSGVAIAAVHREAFEAGHGEWVALPVTELDPEGELVAGVDTEIAMFYGLLDDATQPTTMSTTEPSTTSMTETTTTGETGSETIDPPETSETEQLPLSFAADIEPIIFDNCIAAPCHDAGGQSPVLAEDAYAHIVDQPSLVASAMLVVPGDASTSYLMHKLDGTHALDAALGGCGCNGSGTSMPQGLDLLPIGTRDLIRDWIDAGAEP